MAENRSEQATQYRKAKAREKGQVRLEGKEYIVQDGDVILFRHSG